MKHKFLTNRVLISHLRKGHEEAYNFMVEHYYDMLFAYAFSLSRDRAISQDLVQNIFFKVWKKRNTLKEEYSLKSFLYKAIYNEFINQYRKSKALEEIEAKYIEAINDSENFSYNSLIEKINKEIERFPPRCREIFVMSKREGLTNQEIAEYLNLSLKSVEAQITKGYAVLRQKFHKDLGSYNDEENFLKSNKL